MNFGTWSGTPKSIKTIEEYRLTDLKSVNINRSNIYSDIKFETESGKTININDLLKSNADSIYALTSRIKETAINKAHPQTPALLSTMQTPTQRLQYLKDMLDGGLITQSEFDAKKAELLSKL